MAIAWILLGLLIGGGAGAVASLLIVGRRGRQVLTRAQTDLTLATERAADAQRNHAAATASLESTRQQLAAEQQERAALAATLTAASDNLRRQTDAAQAAVAAVETHRQELAGLQQERAALVANLWDPLESTCRHASLSIL